MTFRAGDWARVRSLPEILRTVDDDGLCERMPFMLEMAVHCGKRFRVLRRVGKTCLDGYAEGMAMFPEGDVVFLGGLRCTGEHHGGCQRGCMLFWREAWLRPDSEQGTEVVEEVVGDDVLARIRTSDDLGRYHCQSTALAGCTSPMARIRRLTYCLSRVSDQTYRPLEMLGLMIAPLFRKVWRKLAGIHPRGVCRRTPDETLGLQPGDWVEVKSLVDIKATLDRQGRNRGLEFTPDMVKWCGGRFRVLNRLERIICESTGELLQLKNTVVLENIVCGCPFSFGGCPREEWTYWREIWLRPVDGPDPDAWSESC